MKISIIVPVYNVEEYIVRCFKSIVQQSYQNIECIFVDDKTPDLSMPLLQKEIAEYSGPISFQILTHAVNKGLSAARNTGTIEATGDYLFYLDSDDEIPDNAIQSLVNLAQKYVGVDLVQGNTKTLPDKGDDNWRELDVKGFPEYSTDVNWIQSRILSFNLAKNIPQNAWNKLIKRDFLLENKLFFKEGVIHEDFHWIFFVSSKIQSIAFSSDYCYVHYVVAGSIMQSLKYEKSFNARLLILKDFLEFSEKQPNSTFKKYTFLRAITYLKELHKIDSKAALISEYILLIKDIFKKSPMVFKIQVAPFMVFVLVLRANLNNFLGRLVFSFYHRFVFNTNS